MPTANDLTCSCAGEERWRPTPVQTLVRFVDAAIPVRDRRHHGNVINKNVVYALQYCQYLQKTLKETLPTSVLTAQQVKSYNINVVAMIEATLEYVLRADCGYDKRRLHAADIEKEWKKSTNIDIEPLFRELSKTLAVRNRVHLVKHDDDPRSMWRDTTYNFFLDYGDEPTTTLLNAFLRSPLFETASNRIAVLAAFDANVVA